LVIDLRRVTFIDVAGVRSLLNLEMLTLAGVLDQLPLRAAVALAHA
jgi:anti-anti-sigma regulatory factor